MVLEYSTNKKIESILVNFLCLFVDNIFIQNHVKLSARGNLSRSPFCKLNEWCKAKGKHRNDLCNYLQAKTEWEKELEAALQRLRRKNTDISQESAEIKVAFYILCSWMNVCCVVDIAIIICLEQKMRWLPFFFLDYAEICQQQSEARILDLFQLKYAHSLIVSVTN